MELEPIGADFFWRNPAIEMDIQRMERLDLEQNKNFLRKVIHTMWKRICGDGSGWIWNKVRTFRGGLSTEWGKDGATKSALDPRGLGHHDARTPR
jgi:hypothetical protein